MKTNNNIEELLKSVSFKIGTLNEAKQRFSAQLAPDFCLFNYLRSDEMGISRIIADLLDPNATHGQGSVFLQAFAEILDQKWICQTTDWHITTEKQANGQRRIDIYLESSTCIIGIENKPWAADQDNQLIDYADYLRKQAVNKKWLLLYLGNQTPSEASISKQKLDELTSSGNLICLTFSELCSWLDVCSIRAKALNVRMFIEEFSNFIRRNINGEMDMSERNEVTNEIRKSSSNIISAFHISNSMNNFKKELIQLLHNQLQVILLEKNFPLIWDKRIDGDSGWKSNSGFGIKFNAQQDKYLRIEFEGSGLNKAFWGIRRENKSVEHNKEQWQSINNVMQEIFGAGKQYPWWSWCSSIPDTQFSKEYKNWESSATPWIEITNGSLATKIFELAVRVHEHFEKSNKLHLLSPTTPPQTSDMDSPSE